jgi:TolA-binding protein
LELGNELGSFNAKGCCEQSRSERRGTIIKQRATFWLAETDYNLANYKEALIGFKQFAAMSSGALPELQSLNYHLGYTYFKLKDYTASTDYFQKYLDQEAKDAQRTNDAYLRLGDGHFVSSNYRKAIEAYEQASVLNAIETDYAAFQSAMSFGYLGEVDKKIALLEQFTKRYKNSGLRDDAYYDLGNTYVKTNTINKALSSYDQLMREYPSSIFIPKIHLRRGLVFYNSDQNEKALEEFRNLVENYPSSEEAIQAVATARLIYIDIGRVDEYARWIQKLDFVELSDADLDHTTYLAAEKQFIDGQSDKAIEQFNKYINNFPRGIHTLKAHFYLAQLYDQANLPENAQGHYAFVVEQPRNEFSEQALVRLSEIYLNNKSWRKALALLEKLEDSADYLQNQLYARSNLMKVHFQLEDFKASKDYATQLLSDVKDEQIKQDAQIIIARSAMALGDTSTAESAYLELNETSNGAIAAEALYYKAYFENLRQEYERSNRSLQVLIKDYSSYKEYAAKGLVVMAKNYDALDDAFQATYILESVIENFQDFPSVLEEAREELTKIKRVQSKTNSSIETRDN